MQRRREVLKRVMMLRITQKKSAIGKPERQKRILRALGIKRLNRSVLQKDSPQIKGMIRAVSHLVQVEEEK